MKFKIGDKIKITKEYLRFLSTGTVNQIKDGGIIIDIYKRSARIKFYSGIIYQIDFTDLELTKNQQLLFDFYME